MPGKLVAALYQDPADLVHTHPSIHSDREPLFGIQVSINNHGTLVTPNQERLSLSRRETSL
jgi:hypothetical protein